MSVIVERPLGRDQGRDLDIYQIFGRIQGKSVARSRRGEKLGNVYNKSLAAIIVRTSSERKIIPLGLSEISSLA